MREIDRIDTQNFFPRVGESRTREHRFKVRGGDRLNRNLRGNLFIERVVGVWKELPEEAGTIATFKKYLDRIGGIWAKSS